MNLTVMQDSIPSPRVPGIKAAALPEMPFRINFHNCVKQNVFKIAIVRGIHCYDYLCFPPGFYPCFFKLLLPGIRHYCA